METRAYVFDAYGTLFDVHSVVSYGGGDITGDLQTLSTLWRRKQLEYTWLRSLMGSYADFWDVTEAALHFAVEQLQIEATTAQFNRLMRAYLLPSAFLDARSALEALKGVPLAILSNGSPRMLESAVQHNGLGSYFSEVISADRARTCKPSPRVYALGPEILKVPAGEIVFVSSNAWDAAGAKAFGYKVCWCNRSGSPWERLGVLADMTVHTLNEITERL